MIKILEDANIKLSSVLTSVDGASGTRIINDIIDGKTNAVELSQHYHGKTKASKEEFTKALEGRLTADHQFMLKTIKQSITDNETLIKTIDAQIDRSVERYSVEISNLQTIDGVGRDSAISIISEIGVNMDVFPSAAHLSSWSGMSPGSNESGGKKKVQEPSMAINTFNQL